MELEPDVRPRLDVPHARQQEGRQDFLVAQPLVDPPGHLLQQPLARGVLEHADDGLDLGLEPHDLRVELGLVGRDRPQRREEAQVAEARQCAARRGRLQETTSIRSHAHGCSCSRLERNPAAGSGSRPAIGTTPGTSGNDGPPAPHSDAPGSRRQQPGHVARPAPGRSAGGRCERRSRPLRGSFRLSFLGRRRQGADDLPETRVALTCGRLELVVVQRLPPLGEDLRDGR